MATQPHRTEELQQTSFLIILAVVSLLMAVIVYPFAQPLLWAALAAIMFQPLNRWFLRQRYTGPNRATILTLLLNTIAFVIGTLSRNPRPVERIQAGIFVKRHLRSQFATRGWKTRVSLTLHSRRTATKDRLIRHPKRGCGCPQARAAVLKLSRTDFVPSDPMRPWKRQSGNGWWHLR